MTFKARHFFFGIVGLAAICVLAVALVLGDGSGDPIQMAIFSVVSLLSSAAVAALAAWHIKSKASARWYAILVGALVPIFSYLLSAIVFIPILMFAFSPPGRSPGFDLEAITLLIAAFVGVGTVMTGWLAIPGSGLIAWWATRKTGA